VVVPDDFSLKSQVEVEKAVEEHSKFRKKVTQFFIAMLQRFVFTDEKMPHQVSMF